MVNDTSHIYTILLLFIVLSLVLGYVGTFFNQQNIIDELTPLEETNDPLGDFTNGTSIDVDSTTSAWSNLKLVFKIFVWSLGDIVWWVELILIVPFRLLGVVLIYRLLRSGGG